MLTKDSHVNLSLKPLIINLETNITEFSSLNAMILQTIDGKSLNIGQQKELFSDVKELFNDVNKLTLA